MGGRGAMTALLKLVRLTIFSAAGSISSISTICMSLVDGVLIPLPLVCAGVSAPLVAPDEEPFAA